MAGLSQLALVGSPANVPAHRDGTSIAGSPPSSPYQTLARSASLGSGSNLDAPAHAPQEAQPNSAHAPGDRFSVGTGRAPQLDLPSVEVGGDAKFTRLRAKTSPAGSATDRPAISDVEEYERAAYNALVARNVAKKADKTTVKKPAANAAVSMK